MLYLCSLLLFISVVQAQFSSLIYNQTLDHFNTQDNTTFPQRYYINDDYWDGTGPIIMLLGAEIRTDADQMNYTILATIGAKLNALLVGTEHRYYGLSSPFGENPTPTQLGYLTVDQALQDYVEITLDVVQTYNASGVPVYAMGGSYGGLLASAIRIRYPEVFWGAWASGAPVNLEIVDPAMWFNATSYAYILENEEAATVIATGFKELVQIIETQTGRDQIQEMFKICNPLNSTEDGMNFLFWAQWAFVGPAEFNYGLPSLYGIPYPLKHMCSILLSTNNSLQAVADAVTFSWNFTGVYITPPCFPTINIWELAGPTGVGLWQFDYQVCSQVYIPSGSNGVTDLFYQTNETLIMANMLNFCKSTYGVMPDLTYWKDNFYGDGKYKAVTNILFTHGIYDPVRGFGVLQSMSESVVLLEAVMAHTEDLLLPFPDEDPSVNELRSTCMQYLSSWTSQYYNV